MLQDEGFQPKRFQSLGRDSVCSYWLHPDGRIIDGRVSIPRSGFCLFILQHRRRAVEHYESFNPSVGILFVHTGGGGDDTCFPAGFQSLGRDSVCSYRSTITTTSSLAMFQSLGRDSVCSYPAIRAHHPRPGLVSIPRSGFCLFIPVPADHDCGQRDVSIPRSGFCLFIRGGGSRNHRNRYRFNPSVGILFVHTWVSDVEPPAGFVFQSLGRDSVCSYRAGWSTTPCSWSVSIPRSGFCLFIPAGHCAAG